VPYLAAPCGTLPHLAASCDTTSSEFARYGIKSTVEANEEFSKKIRLLSLTALFDGNA
jgi:hypothetical protein